MRVLPRQAQLLGEWKHAQLVRECVMRFGRGHPAEPLHGFSHFSWRSGTIAAGLEGPHRCQGPVAVGNQRPAAVAPRQGWPLLLQGSPAAESSTEWGAWARLSILQSAVHLARRCVVHRGRDDHYRGTAAAGSDMNLKAGSRGAGPGAEVLAWWGRNARPPLLSPVPCPSRQVPSQGDLRRCCTWPARRPAPVAGRLGRCWSMHAEGCRGPPSAAQLGW